MNLMNLECKNKQNVEQLSGGEQQRVAIARAMACNPKIIIADEPTGALDSVTGQHIMKIFKDINKNEKTTIIIVTHDEKVAGFSNHILYMKDGELNSDGGAL